MTSGDKKGEREKESKWKQRRRRGKNEKKDKILLQRKKEKKNCRINPKEFKNINRKENKGLRNE